MGAMAGHLFVIRGDLTHLKCNALLVPCDSNWEVIWEHWSALLPEDQFEPSYWGRRWKGRARGRTADVWTHDERRICLVVTADGRDDADWVAAGVTEAVERFATDRRLVAGRVKPLIALPLVGTGAGGFEYRRGTLIRALLPALRTVAHRADVDVALVLRDDRDHVAIQGQRSSTDWEGFAAEELRVADELGARAARQELSLFLGSGVSVPLGLPDWKGLLEEIAGEEISDYTPEKAPAIAQELEARIGRGPLEAEIMRKVAVSGCAPAHLLLAGLAVRQNVTTNYDAAYELAFDGSIGSAAYRVMTRQIADQPAPWLLKLHGDVRRPSSIVVTENDYRRLETHHSATLAVVESLLMTSHLVFVGYSLADQDFADAVDRVRRVRSLAGAGGERNLATVLALHPDSVSTHQGFTTVPMSSTGSGRDAARRLEIFLDRMSWAAARHSSRSDAYLLDPDYADLFEDDHPSVRLREVLEPLVALPANDPARRSSGWRRVEEMLTELGGRPRVAEQR